MIDVNAQNLKHHDDLFPCLMVMTRQATEHVSHAFLLLCQAPLSVPQLGDSPGPTTSNAQICTAQYADSGTSPNSSDNSDQLTSNAPSSISKSTDLTSDSDDVLKKRKCADNHSRIVNDGETSPSRACEAGLSSRPTATDMHSIDPRLTCKDSSRPEYAPPGKCHCPGSPEVHLKQKINIASDPLRSPTSYDLLSPVPDHNDFDEAFKEIAQIPCPHERAYPRPQYRPKCLDSTARFRPKKEEPGETKVYECTNGCGQTFPRRRRGDWVRHERVNIEDWVCPICGSNLSRKEKLRDHMKAGHQIQSAQLDDHRRQLLSPSQRACEFCGEKFDNWSVWINHVSAHYEGSDPSYARKKLKPAEEGIAGGETHLRASTEAVTSGSRGQTSNSRDLGGSGRGHQQFFSAVSPGPAKIIEDGVVPTSSAVVEFANEGDHGLVSRMATLAIWDAGANCPSVDSKDSDHSCSCTRCMRNLPHEEMGVAVEPRARASQGCLEDSRLYRLAPQQFYGLERYIQAPRREEPYLVGYPDPHRMRKLISELEMFINLLQTGHYVGDYDDAS